MGTISLIGQLEGVKVVQYNICNTCLNVPDTEAGTTPIFNGQMRTLRTKGSLVFPEPYNWREGKSGGGEEDDFELNICWI